jgi:hypothetical protein
MKKSIATAVVTSILFCSTVHAASVTVTPPLLDGSAADAICCVANLTAENATPLIEIITGLGNVSQSLSPTILPFGIGCLVDTTPIVSTCRVSNVPSKKIRVTYCMVDESQNCIASVTVP